MRIIYRRWVSLLRSPSTLRRSLLLICGVHLRRRQLYGEDDLSATDDDHILHLGPGRAARVRQHASTRLQ